MSAAGISAVIDAVNGLRGAAKARAKAALQLVIDAKNSGELPLGAAARVVRDASSELGKTGSVGRDALRSLTSHRAWLPLPLLARPCLRA